MRILGGQGEFADLLARADAIFIERLRKADWYDKTSQAFAVFLPSARWALSAMRGLRVVIALRAVETVDFMTAEWAHLRTLLGTISSRIINELRGISRVFYDISASHPPPSNVE